MNVLVACEYSGVVRNAFANRGHYVMSCDLLDTEQECIGDSHHYKGDIKDLIDDNRLIWDLMIAFPPCFVGNSLVMTKTGYQYISDIKIGDYVLTHKGRWRKVINTMCKYANETITLKITGSSPIITTKNHPFYIKRRSWKNINGVNNKIESIATWKNAGDLSKGDLIGSILPPISNTTLSVSDEHLWLMGLYVADGHLRYRNSQFESMYLSLGLNKFEEFKKKIKRKYSINIVKSVVKINMYGKDFCKSFAQFGRSCDSKSLPIWVLSLPTDKAKIFLDGYLFGDGYIKNNMVSSSSISKKLTLSIAILMKRVYNRVISIAVNKRKKYTVIEGRTVRQNTAYVAYCKISKRSLSSINNKYFFSPYRNTTISKADWVYNLSVEEDESYMVDNCIVHNCTHLAVSGSRWFKDKVKEQAEALDFVSYLMDCRISKICIENPISIISSRIRKPDQIIQPWQFGHPEQKTTCLWLKNLPKLIPNANSSAVYDQMMKLPKHKRERVHYLMPGKNRWKERIWQKNVVKLVKGVLKL